MVDILYYSTNNVWKDDVSWAEMAFFTSNRQFLKWNPAWKSRLYSTTDVVEPLIDHAEEMFVLRR